MKEGCTKAAVDFLINDLLKRAVTKHKKGTETFSCIWTESYPKFPVYGQNIRVFPYTGK